jgi:dipeptidyl aminopeptidase/acylaminoacyl peptidase
MPKTSEEIPVSVPMKQGVLAGSLHLPGGRRPGRGWPAVLMCHGFTGTRIEAHFMFVRASRRLAAEGIASLRFDFRGSGESSGRFEDMSILTELADALAAWDFLGERAGVDPSRRAVLGLSLGGAVAALLTGGLSAEGREPEACVLWSAVGDIEELWEVRFKQLGIIKRKLIRFPISMGAFQVGERFFKDAKEAPRPFDALAAANAPVLIVHGTSDESVPVEHARRFARLCGKKRATLKILRSADHVYNRPDWERKVIDGTAAWLKKKLREASS